jgi:adenylate cyclase
MPSASTSPDGAAPALSPPAKEGARASSLLRRILHVSGWPIAAKLSVLLLASSLAPMGLTAALDIHQARGDAEQAEMASLERLAQSTAGRVEQLLEDDRRVVGRLAAEAEVRKFLTHGDATADDVRESARESLKTVVSEDDGIVTAFLLDAHGICVMSTRDLELKKDFSARQYFKEAGSPGGYISELLTGATSHQPGIYFSRAVQNQAGAVLGVAVLKVSGDRIDRTVASVDRSAGGAFVVDDFGVIISHSDPRLLYKSLAPLSAEDLRDPAFDQRFTSVGVDHIQSLDLGHLAQRMRDAKVPQHTSFLAPLGGDREIAGIAPVPARSWAVCVYRPESAMDEQFDQVSRRSLANALLVGTAMTLLALVLARTIVRPVRRLIDAAVAMRRGAYHEAFVHEGSEDEMGDLAAAFNTLAQGLAQREREHEIFGRMVSPEVREHLLSGRLGLGGETRWAVVLFSDIRGFSTLAETMDPQAVVTLLNEYLTEMTAAVTPYGGYINNFIGDAIVVIFGAPVPTADAEARAVAAAIAMRAALAKLNERRTARSDPPIETGIGIAAGDMVAGQIGSPARMLYTVIGDAVNVASRLETLTKDYPGKSILVTRRVAAALGPERAMEPLGPVKLKGRAEPVEVFAIVT